MQQVSILLAEKENEWSHQAMDKQQQTSNYQVKMIEYQVQMLRAQQLIASRTKRDNTVMKVIAVLTSLFLPGTFIAVSLGFIRIDFADFQYPDYFQRAGLQLERGEPHRPTLYDILVFHCPHHSNLSYWLFSVVFEDVV